MIIASLLKKGRTGFHNPRAVLDADGTYLGKYRKMHIPDDPGFYEKFYFTPGDLGYKVFSTQFAKIGVLICWDQWYPESARITSLMGAEILFYPTAIGWASHQSEQVNAQQYQAWQMIQRSHAIANGLFVAAVNRTGIEGEMSFWGGSFIASPFGALLGEAAVKKRKFSLPRSIWSSPIFTAPIGPFCVTEGSIATACSHSAISRIFHDSKRIGLLFSR